MVHIKYASIACRAMMASFWLEYMANQALPFLFMVRIVKEVPPIEWYSPRVSSNCADE